MIKFSLIHRVAYFLLSQGSPQAPVPSSSSVFQSHPCGSGVLLPGCGRTDLCSSACRGCGWPQTQEEGTSPSQPASHLGPCGLLARLQTAHEVMNPPKPCTKSGLLVKPWFHNIYQSSPFPQVGSPTCPSCFQLSLAHLASHPRRP